MLNDAEAARIAELATLDRPLTDDETDELLTLMDELSGDYRPIETVRVVGGYL